MSIETLKKALGEGAVWVEFTKKDGTVRRGSFTTSEKLVPPEKQPKSDSARKVPTESTRVFDLEKQEWRSFINESVIEWDVI